ncbi:peptidoglycan-binding protein [Mesorhizobium sp. L-8-3]|uniref:peptidoglycan-binding protein n=1 Tax=Mesorhizobium sp. L-8-3 TaxID=2744522 RepID=UPI0019261ABF|nr:peptidoglycan-binding protein [Mesorhizobium sp. L-8-3]
MRRLLFVILTVLSISIWSAFSGLAQFNPESLLRQGLETILNEAARPSEPPVGRTPGAHARPVRPAQGSSSQVAEVQALLTRLGYSPGAIDGRMGSKTRRAIADFQRDAGMAITGRADRALLTALRALQPTGTARLPASSADSAASAASSSLGSLQSAGAGSFAILPGYDLPYGDYRSGMSEPALRDIPAARCQQLCADDDRCQAFTYNAQARVCILKDSVPQRVRFAAAVSGIKQAAADGVRTSPALAQISQSGIPTLNGRLLVRGRGPQNILSDGAVTEFGRMTARLALSQFPDMFEDENFAFASLLHLDAGTQRRIVASAGLAADKVMGVRYRYWQGLDEFERRALLQSIRAEVPPIVALEPHFPPGPDPLHSIARRVRFRASALPARASRRRLRLRRYKGVRSRRYVGRGTGGHRLFAGTRFGTSGPGTGIQAQHHGPSGKRIPHARHRSTDRGIEGKEIGQQYPAARIRH